MYTKLFYKLIFISGKLFSLLGPLGMKFDPSSKKFVGTAKLRKLQLYGCLSLTLQMLIACWGTHQVYTKYPGGLYNPVFHICFAFSFIMVIVCFPLWLLYFKQEELKNGMNRAIKYSVQFQGASSFVSITEIVAVAVET
ncbi:hypothetical protein Fcan01_08896 [Folsomia candida]|uniref:Uncharacterized protein n=1 Tax=Folsomia candida TaxID=158441 RepID=A0A226EF35_FOLCA|nr:hypothetical protein Fcan01_08896 [Folsomia candida]